MAGALGDTPETVISVHLLARGPCRAYVAGDPARFKGAVVQSVTRYQSGVIVLSRLPNQLTLCVVATEKANLAKVWDATGGIITEMARLLR